MLFSVEILDLVLYCVQQLGVMLSVGAETILLISFIITTRDGRVDETEARFARAVHQALAFGLFFMLSSGIAIVAVHGSLGEWATVGEPAFLFKWVLMIALTLIYLWQRTQLFSHSLVEGAVGGTWYALFVLHILAPITSWVNLLVLYAVFVLGFLACWMAAVGMSRREVKSEIKKEVKNETEKKKTITRAQPPPPPRAPLPEVAPAILPLVVKAETPLPSKPTPPAPVPQRKVVALEKKPDAPQQSFWLPFIHVMPQSKEELEKRSHLISPSSFNKTA